MQNLDVEEGSLLRCGAKPSSAGTSHNIWNTSLLETLCLTCFKVGPNFLVKAARAQFSFH